MPRNAIEGKITFYSGQQIILLEHDTRSVSAELQYWACENTNFFFYVLFFFIIIITFLQYLSI